MTPDEIKDLNGSELASMAGLSASPDSPTSPGSVFLADVRDWYLEHRNDDDVEDNLTVVGDYETGAGVLDHRTRQVWLTFTDLALWQEDDLDEFGRSYKFEDITKAAQDACAEVGYRLARALYEADDLRSEDDD